MSISKKSIYEFAPELFSNKDKSLLLDLDGTGARPIIFYCGLDISESMSQHHNKLIESFNRIIVPSLRRAGGFNNPMLIGGNLFSDKLIPLWEDFKSLKRIKEKPLNLDIISHHDLRGQNSLYYEMIASLILTHNAMEQVKKQDRDRSGGVLGRICILTNGTDNLSPFSPKDVRCILDEYAPKDKYGRRNIQAVLVFLETNNGLNENDARYVAKESGFEFTRFNDLIQNSADPYQISFKFLKILSLY